VSLTQVSGTVQNDILKEYIARGTYIYPLEPALRLVTDIFAFCHERAPEWNTISISGYHIREAGSTAVQELAFTLANAVGYIEAALERGLAVDAFAPRLSFFLNSHNGLLEEVAKFRAARRLWARLMRERFKAENPRSWVFRFHAQTGGSTLTAQQPDVNIARVTLQALAAVLGGTQSLHANGRDEALSLPTEASATLALRTQQVIAFESGVTNTVDPLGGSYYVEKVTGEIEQGAEEYLKKIDAMGGVRRAIEMGYIQREIQQAAYEYQKRVESGEQVVVGVNRYTVDGASSIPILRIDPEIERSQVERLKKLRAGRDHARVQAALKKVETTARSAANLMPVIIDAVKAYATVGEISDVLRRVFGEYQESVVI
jgi:methylmalonyl-CoA mutase, N-terminal domain